MLRTFASQCVLHMSDRVATLRTISAASFLFERILIADNCSLAPNVLKLMSGNNSRTKEMLKWLLKIENRGKVIVLESFSVRKKWLGSNTFVVNFRSLVKTVKTVLTVLFKISFFKCNRRCQFLLANTGALKIYVRSYESEKPFRRGRMSIIIP